VPEPIADEMPLIVTAFVFGVDIEIRRFQIGPFKSERREKIFQPFGILRGSAESVLILRISTFQRKGDSCRVRLYPDLSFACYLNGKPKASRTEI
jgi:hypothetical protein